LSYLLISGWELGFFNSYLNPGSISTSNERLQNRHAARLFFARSACSSFPAGRATTKAAGLAGLRFHDLRHHAITELAESQVSDQTIMAIAGHVSQKMLARSSHVRSEARRQAVMALSAKHS
jgi:integrase